MRVKMHADVHDETTKHTNTLETEDKFVSARIYLSQVQTPRGGNDWGGKKKKEQEPGR